MIDYTLHRSTRAKRMSIRVTSDETVTVVIPHTVSENHAERFFESKKAWVEQAIWKMRKRKRPSFAVPRAARKDYEVYREQARTLVLKRLQHFNVFYGLSWNQVAIKNTSSRWGSCSKRKNLNFNYRIVFLPEAYADYLVVHELCHLKEFNHSKQFWSLVAETIPEYKLYKKEMRLL